MKIETEIAHIKYNENATIQLPSYFFTSTPLILAELLLEFLKEKRPSCVEQVVERAVFRLQELDADVDTEGVEFTYEREHLREYPRIEALIKGNTLRLLNYATHEEELKKEMATLPRRVYNRARFSTLYLMLAALTDTVSREDALDLSKQFMEFVAKELGAIVAPPTESLRVIYERHQKAHTGDSELHSTLLDSGRLACRIDRCMPEEILQAYGDSELVRATLCHFHFPQAVMANPNFVLTRTKTLVDGDSYCDFCWHDKRFDPALEHPAADVFENLVS